MVIKKYNVCCVSNYELEVMQVIVQMVLYENIKKIVMTLSAQVGWAGTNFAVTAILARYLEPAAFGVFGLFLASKRGVLLLTGGGLIIPLTVISARLEGDEKELFIHKLINTLYCVTLVIVGLAILAGIIFDLPFVSLTFFLMGAMLLEVNRRLAYIKGRIKKDMAGAFFYGVTVLILLYGLINKALLSVPSATTAIGTVYIVWVVLSGPKIIIKAGLLRLDDIRLMWQVGGWVLASNAVTYAYSEINTLYTLFLIGPTGVAVLELGRQFVAVLQPVLFGMANYFHPKIATSANTDKIHTFSNKLLKLTGVQMLIGLLIISAMLIIGPYVLNVIVGKAISEYQDVMTIASLLGAGAILKIGWQQPGFALVSLGHSKYSFIARALGAVFAIMLGYILTKQFGVMGAAWTKLSGDALIFILSTFLVIKVMRKKRAH